MKKDASFVALKMIKSETLIDDHIANDTSTLHLKWDIIILSSFSMRQILFLNSNSENH